jgi:transposase
MIEMITIPKAEYDDLKARVEELELLVAKLTQDLNEALRRLNQNSSNSNLPSSRDLFKKSTIVNTRGKSDKPPGGQPGHKGSNLKQTVTPDAVEINTPQTCEKCDANLSGIPVDTVAKRQEITVKSYKYTKEYRVESKTCVCCGEKNVGKFPEHIKGPVQYGAEIKADVVYSILQQMISCKRFRQEMHEKYDVNISDGTVANIIAALAENLIGFGDELVAYMVKAIQAHFDETGININGKNHWMFVMSDEFVSLFKAHLNRSQQALDDIAVFPRFTGLAIHDCYEMYFSNENCTHAICHAHILRELKGLLEQEAKEVWAQELTDFLIDTNKKRATFSQNMIEEKVQQFRAIVQNGLAYHASLPALTRDPKKKRGKIPQRKGKNLLDRLVKYEDAAVRFVQDTQVPFTNNQAERDLRMIKVKLKISIFREKLWADRFALIRSYIETAKKLGLDVFQVLVDAFAGRPFSLMDSIKTFSMQGP